MIHQITPTELNQKLSHSTEHPQLLDVRETWEYNICNINHSINIPMAHHQQISAQFDLEKEIVVICHHGMRSQQVAQYLEQSGCSQVCNLSGGVHAWAQDIDPNMAQY